jgi:N-acetylglutamate synthase-like GNAT family acetyltransferase
MSTASEEQGKVKPVVVEIKPTIRDATASDAKCVLELFEAGALSGEAPNASDDSSDLEDLSKSYLADTGPRLWIAELGDRAVGMVAVWPMEEDVYELRRLRVMPDVQGRGVGKALVNHALAHCRDSAALKVVLDTFVERSAAIGLFERFGFKLARSKTLSGKQRLDFYLDLYREVTPDDDR